MLDLISTHNGVDNLAKYNIKGYRHIVKYKTSYYSFYLPVSLKLRVACALLLSGAKLENFSGSREIAVEMGIYFQAQDDYLDCFADPNTIGKALGHADTFLFQTASHDIFSEFEDQAFKHLVASINAQQDRAMQEILKSFLKKIHRRKK
ncbi:hypothetical protein PR202_gb14088 [Eleusine coracana subsp. coracana]|uniref:Uncharacterized protein n=1 Tax=Eleusine coracana subsp. coracana TaxID=191504 RepID=A0AAV5ETQ7_ELECO|nr:hypothetical protein PR202_gb14088 [Eleusine coracana subsp. coracana]